MSVRASSRSQNQLLVSLLPQDRLRLGVLELVTLALRQPIDHAGTDVATVYFPETALVSVVSHMRGRKDVEVGVIGREGMTGLALIQGDTQSPFESFVQIAGKARSMNAARLMAAVNESPTLKAALLLHGRAFDLQVASTTVANGSHKLEERLARWLLMVGDRVGEQFKITHEFLSLMLAVRRSGVTLALQNLEGRGLITSTRGKVSILNRRALIAASAGSYGMAERESDRLVGQVTAA
jgi:CRP-like cAMP-binding protein